MSRHSTPRAEREGSRIPRPPTNRGPLILAALVIGAVLAWLPGGISGVDTPTSLTGSDSSYGIGSDSGLPLGVDGTPRQALSAAEAAARLESLVASRSERGANQYFLPVVGRFTSCFCMRWGDFHSGIDIAAPTGTPIVAPETGVVLEAGPASGYGSVIYLQHENGDVTVYGHMSEILVDAGQIVEGGELIAEVGNLGYSTGPHLHFEVQIGGKNGEAVDPVDWLLERGIDVHAAG